MGGSIFCEADFAYFGVVRSGCGSMVAAGEGSERPLKRFWGAVRKGW